MSGKLRGIASKDSNFLYFSSLLTSVLVLSASITALVVSLHSVGLLRAIQLGWNVCFGFLIALPHIELLEPAASRFGFVHTWLGRGSFLLYAGTSVFPSDQNSSDISKVLSWVAGFACLGCGLLELFMGCCGYQETSEHVGDAAAPLMKDGKPATRAELVGGGAGAGAGGGGEWQVSQAKATAEP